MYSVCTHTAVLNLVHTLEFATKVTLFPQKAANPGKRSSRKWIRKPAAKYSPDYSVNFLYRVLQVISSGGGSSATRWITRTNIQTASRSIGRPPAEITRTGYVIEIYEVIR